MLVVCKLPQMHTPQKIIGSIHPLPIKKIPSSHAEDTIIKIETIP